jgi:hypothetical protein
MDRIARVELAYRQSPQAIGSMFRSSLRQVADARVDIPEVQESARVSFTGGAAVAAVGTPRNALDMYRWVQSL